MPLIYSKKPEDRYHLAVWHSTEETAELEAMLHSKPVFAEVKSERRKRELISARIILQKILGENVTVNYEETGKPVIKGYDVKISVAHTGNFVAVLINKQYEAGVDIEVMNNRIFKIAPRFVSEEEKRAFKINSNKDLYKIWGAKEVAFKIYGQKGVDFRKDLQCTPVDAKRIAIKHEAPGIIKKYILESIEIPQHQLLLVYGFDKQDKM